MQRIVFNLGLFTGCVLLLSEAAMAQGSWAESLVDTRQLEFGVIATGSEAEKLVTIRNTTQHDVHISHVTTACKCAEVRPQERPVEQNLLRPGEQISLRIGINTYSFRGQRNTSLTIYFDSPQYAEVRIPISAYIRTDVVFKPGKVSFGELDFAAGGTSKVRIEYAGRPDWQIRSIKSSSESLVAVPREVSRNGGNVVYELDVTLDPRSRPGRIRDLITLVTDDAANPYVPLMVEGAVVPDIVLSNSNIAIKKSLKPGESTIVRLVAKGKKPFLVEDVDCKEMGECFEVKLSPDEKSVHVMDIEFTAPNKPGKFAEELFVKIKGREERLRFMVSGTITGG